MSIPHGSHCFYNVLQLKAHVCSGPGSRVRSEPATAEGVAGCPPTSSWWALKTPLTLARRGLERRSSGGQGGGGDTIGDRTAAAAIGFFHHQTLYIRLGREKGGAALQEKDLLDVAAARLHGTAPSRRSLLALVWSGIATTLRRGTGATVASGYGHKAPTRRDGESSDIGSKTRPDEEQGGMLPRKIGTTVSWPR